MSAPLQNIRVLDLSRLFPGPYLSRILADLGADVVKVEGLDGDMVRSLPPQVDGVGAAFVALNYGKRCIAVDLKKVSGRALLLAMAAKADVLVESFRPGVLGRLGLAFETLQQHNPGLILCSITGYGQNGPLRSQPGHDLNYMARAGALSLFGPKDGAPVVPGVQVADFGGGAWPAAVGVLAALLARQQTAKGCHLDVSMAKGAAAYVAVELAQRAQGAVEPRGDGMLTGGRPAYRCYGTKDGRFMALAALEPKFFAAFCQAAGCCHLAQSGFAVGEEGEQVTAQLTQLFAQKTQDEWVALLRGVEACCEPVQTPEEALADTALGLRTHHAHGVAVLATEVGLAPEPSSTSPWTAPAIGEHGAAVAHDYDISDHILHAAIADGAFLAP